ncbi:unnamed protein product, partial [Mesorhabditis spiculigera]
MLHCPAEKVLTLYFAVAFYVPIVSSQFNEPTRLVGFGENPSSITYNSGDRAETVPKGIFHYSNSENNFGANFKVPGAEQIDPLRMISDLMNTAASAEQKRKELSGVYLPMPFGLSPLNLQIAQDGSTGFSTKERQRKPDDQKPSTSSATSPRLQHLFLNARTMCIQESKALCDSALEEYQKAKLGGESALEKRLRAQRVAPDDPVKYLQTEVAKWMLPSLNGGLESVRGNAALRRSPEQLRRDEDPRTSEDSSEARDLTPEVPRRTSNPFGSITWTPRSRNQPQTTRRSYGRGHLHAHTYS